MYKFMIFLGLVAATDYLGAAITSIDSLSKVNGSDDTTIYKIADHYLIPLQSAAEYYLFNISTSDISHDGYIAASSCHLQRYLPHAGKFNVDYNNGRQVQIDTTITGKSSLNPKVIGLITLSTGFDLKLGLMVSNTDSTGVDYSCVVKPGQTCQAFIKPHVVKMKAQGMVGTLKDLMLQSQTQIPEFLQWSFPIENTGSMICVCDDQVESLACESRINYYDQNDPIRLDYRI